MSAAVWEGIAQDPSGDRRAHEWRIR